MSLTLTDTTKDEGRVMDTKERVLRGLVKPLVWEESLRDRWIGTPIVKLGDLAFWIFRHHDGSFKRATKNGWQHHPTLAVAQSAAEADYRARIAAALDLDKLVALVEAAVAFQAKPVLADSKQMNKAVNGIRAALSALLGDATGTGG